MKDQFLFLLAALFVAVVGVALVLGGIWVLWHRPTPVEFAAAVMALVIGLKFLWTLRK